MLKEAGANLTYRTRAPCGSATVYGRFSLKAVMQVPWSGQPKASHPPFLHRSFVAGTVGPQLTVKVSEAELPNVMSVAVFLKVPHALGVTLIVASKGSPVE